MKKRILRSCVGLTVLAAFMLPACELIENCGTCVLVIDGEEQIPIYDCGDSYQDKLNSSPLTVDGVTSYWDCY